MTTAIASEVTRRRAPKPRATQRSVWLMSADALDDLLAKRGEKLADYREDPVGFARDVLGYVPCRTIAECEAEVERQRAETPGEEPRILWPKQIEILEAVRDHKRVTVRSGHKVSKSFTAGIVALWFYASFHEARVVCTAVTSRQVDEIIWREIRRLRAKARKPIAGECGELARTGLKSDDFRELVGFTAREAEAVAGVSGKNLLYIADEASGIGPEIFEAIEGNRAGGARLLMLSNPTKTAGDFFESHTGKKDFLRIHVSSEESPNVQAGREIIAGLATLEWVEEKRREWGVDSPLYKIRVRGDFVFNEEGRVISVELLRQAEERWGSTRDVGRLEIGIDPAGPGLGGDQTAFAARRGFRLSELVALNGLTEAAILTHLLGMLRTHRRPSDREKPLVKIDREGPIGGTVYGVLRAHLERNPNDFDLVAVRASDRAVREPDKFDRVRDELWWNLFVWLREGGAILEDARLAAELHAPHWHSQATGRVKVTGKEELRKILDGRSPDRADALSLAVWVPIAFAGATVPVDGGRAEDDDEAGGGELDPYAGTIDPYAGNGWRDG